MNWDLIVVGGGAAGLAAALTAARRGGAEFTTRNPEFHHQGTTTLRGGETPDPNQGTNHQDTKTPRIQNPENSPPRTPGIGSKVLILERTNECGKKLALTGGKKGNFTHTDEPDVMTRQFNTEPRKLLPLMRRFPYSRIVDFFAELGIRHLVDEEGCVWPNPKSAPRLRDALVDAIRRAGGVIEVHAHVTDIHPQIPNPKSKIQMRIGSPSVPPWVVSCGKQEYVTQAVLIATGGKSYPATGSSGDGYELAARLGHRVEPVYSALASLVTDGAFKELSGITIGKTRVKLRIGVESSGVQELRSSRSGSEALAADSGHEETAPFLFAGDCITGRAIINLCGFAARALLAGRTVTAMVDWLPDLSDAELRAEIADERIRHGRVQVNNFIAAKSAKRLANLLCARANIPQDRILAGLSREELLRLTDALKRTEIGISGTEPLARATVTGGGVALDEVDLGTFESKLQQGLFFAGEVLDVWGRSGGYNLHFAWASGIAVGETVGEESD